MSQILLTVAYLGTNYSGFQVQNGSFGKKTVQQVLQEALASLYRLEIPVKGCSRTDSGVHAKDFKLTYRTEPGMPEIPFPQLPEALNRFLPPDISVLSACSVPDSFHVRYDVEQKEYEYLILNTRIRDPFWEGRAWHVIPALDRDRMRSAASFFRGPHDFSAFMASGSSVRNTVRTVFRSEVTTDGDLIRFAVSADGFLYNMVRILAGTIVACGLSRISPEQIPDILRSADRSEAGETAPACGLYLSRVQYRKDTGLSV